MTPKPSGESIEQHSQDALAKSFEPSAIEELWYPLWESRGYFRAPASGAGADAPAGYCIQLPPPNVTGTLHMGHAFQQTLMDTLIRYHRMRGEPTNWVVGTDHAGIATQIVVERQLQADGKTRHDLGRAAFIDRVWQWKAQSGATITRQMRRLGTSANWEFADTERNAGGYFTMDATMSQAVIEVFVRLYEQGLIYRGKRLVNWDPTLMTAVSDLEVDNDDEDGRIWEIRYPLTDGSGALVVATTRPETMLGDTAVAVHPDDPRYAGVIGKRVKLPLTDRTLPVIADDYVDKDFGTGCLKITPGHDFNDYQVGQRHRLELISAMNLDATMSDAVPPAYRGLDRFEARKRVIADLERAGLLVAEKPHRLSVPRSGRTGVIVEPMLTDQWFVATGKPAPAGTRFPGMSIAEVALAAVSEGKVKFYPEHWASTYNHWMRNIQDWCISRQLWWGHQIPAWYDDSGKVFVARTEADALAQARAAGVNGPLKRDDDVLDTWFSSALVPFSSLGWPRDTADLQRYLPSSVLVTGFDIIFFWVARMVMMTLHFTGEVPFRDVYINAIVRDAEGQKMSKSKGNTIDPIDLIDGVSQQDLLAKSTVGLLRADHKARIEKYIKAHYPAGIPAYGTDAVRFTFASLATFTRTLNFDLSRCEGYRNFCNKLWNATRFVLMNSAGQDNGFAAHTAEQCSLVPGTPGAYLYFSSADRWIVSQLQRTIGEVERGLAEYRFDNAARAIYEFVWNEYCDWYVELAKVQLQGDDASSQRATRRTLLRVLETILRLAHPIIPFITEELWQRTAPLAQRYGERGVQTATGAELDQALSERRHSVMLQRYPSAEPNKIDAASEQWVGELKAMVDAVRSLRGAMRLNPGQRVPLLISAAAGELRHRLDGQKDYLRVLAKLQDVELVEQLPPESNAPVEIVGLARLMLVVTIDVAAERQRLDKDFEQASGELVKAQIRLSNPSFADKAPAAVVDQVRAQIARLQTKIAELADQRAKLGD